MLGAGRPLCRRSASLLSLFCGTLSHSSSSDRLPRREPYNCFGISLEKGAALKRVRSTTTQFRCVRSWSVGQLARYGLIGLGLRKYLTPEGLPSLRAKVAAVARKRWASTQMVNLSAVGLFLALFPSRAAAFEDSALSARISGPERTGSARRGAH